MSSTDDKEKNIRATVFDSKLYTSALSLGAIYVQRGLNDYSEWSTKMKDEVGENIKPWLAAIWETLLNTTPVMKFDEKKVAAISEYIGSRIQCGLVKSYQDVIDCLSETIGSDEVESNIPLINAAYMGIKKIFEDGSIPTSEHPTEKEKTMKKTDSKKKTSSRKTAPPKTEELPVQEIPSPVKIVYQKDMGLINLLDSKGILVSLIRNALEQKFLSIQRVSKGKNGSWKADGGKVWLPFGKMKDVVELIAYAYNEGVKAGWDNDYEPQPMNIQQGNIINFATEKPALRELELRSEDPSIYQVALFRDDKKQ